MKRRKKKNRRGGANISAAETKTNEVRIKSQEDRLFWKLVGVALVLLAAFVAVALATYDWQSVAALNPDPTPTINLMGVVGNSLAYGLYVALGLSAWCVPLAFVGAACKLFVPIPPEVEEISNWRVAVRIAGFVLVALSITGIFQLAGHLAFVQRLVSGMHLGANAGGWIGYWFMTCGLERGVAAFGAVFVSLAILAVAVCMACGLKAVRGWIAALAEIDWHADLSEDANEEEPVDDPVREKEAPPVRQSVPPPAPERRMPERRPKPEQRRIKFPKDGNLPGLDLLDPVPPRRVGTGDAAAIGTKLVETLKVFGVEAELSDTVEGPVVTQFAVTPAPGVRVERITGLSRDLQRALKAKSIRIFAPIPGEDTVGVQIPNRVRETVSFREIVESAEWQNNATWPKGGAPKIAVPLLLGKNVAGEEVVEDLAKMPHLLVAGASGKGKSVCLSAIISGLLMCRTPDQLRLILVDPKGGAEFKVYEKLPHLLVPVVTDVKKVVAALRWAAGEMAARQKRIAEAGVSDIREYNASAEKGDAMPYIVVVIDELADIMIQAGHDVDQVLSRLVALARSTGIHLVLATQRPDVKVIGGTIKANIPGRIAFATTTATDSRTILDDGGAETLIGDGDMLYRTSDGVLMRAQGAFVSRGEKNRIVEFAVKQWPSAIDEELAVRLEHADEEEADPSRGGECGDVSEEEYERAKAVVISTNRASISHIQRQLRVGYNHAAKIVDLLEARGIVGPARGMGAREVLAREG